MSIPEITVIIPVYNEEAVLPSLFERICPAMDALERDYELLFVDDGSRDGSPALLRKQYQARADVTRVVYLRGNFGQHAAILSGFEQAWGRCIITLDADLQNPPEEIHKLLAEWDRGHDYVGTIRRLRRDSLWRRWASKLMNRLRERITNIRMTDQGCMMRAYDSEIVSAILTSKENTTFIPALAYLYASNPIEIEVKHEERAAGDSKYPFYKLVHLNFDLMTGFSIAPLQIFSLAGIGVALASFLFVLYLVWRRIWLGPEVEGVFTLFAILFFLIGILLFGIGLLGEYIGRIYSQTMQRPRYLVRTILEEGEQHDPPPRQ